MHFFFKRFLYEPHYQPLRYLLVGGWNTLFGALAYATLHYFLNQRIHYLVLLIPANLLAITHAFFCYKYLVFHSAGNAWKEYFRCYLVYGWIALVCAGIMALLVNAFHMHPSLANLVCIGIAIIMSYMGHRHFSFRAAPQSDGK
jgi:putative flippase GtrA